MLARVRRPARLDGQLRLPGDKSISHRALMLNAVASGEARIGGLSEGADVASTAACLRALGVEVEEGRVAGVGLRGLREAGSRLDCGNSGTTMRLLAGLLAPLEFETELGGDPSLSLRPMDRVVEPLREMGARASWPPLRVGGGGALSAIEYWPSIPSAQVKSAVLLAGLYASGRTAVHEPVPTRDHTERMLAAMGAAVQGSQVEGPVAELRPLDLEVPGDLSGAAFWLVLAALHPNARLRLPGVGVNPTRRGVLDLLRRLGVRVEETRPRLQGAEPVADLEVATSALGRAFTIAGAESAQLIDELPVLAVAACFLAGRSHIRDARELRVKESDRIAAMAAGLGAMGASIEERDDGLEVVGPARLEGSRVRSFGDHRVAMALAVAGLLADGETEIEDAECVDISYPGFWDQLEALCR